MAEAATDDRLELLLADFLACARAGRSRHDAGSFEQDGVAGTAALLALRSSAADLDDVDWRSLHHPGSVVWPVVVALAMQSDSAGEPLGRAARAGYATAATIADHLGSTHRATWHVTATAGALGAASAASVMLDLPPAGHERALALAAGNLGGLALAARERRGAASFNRAAAATLGLMAARAASVGAVAVEAPFDAPDGLLQAMSGAGSDGGLRVRGGVLDASARLYPVSGFLQSTVASIAALRAQVDGDLLGIRIGLAKGARVAGRRQRRRTVVGRPSERPARLGVGESLPRGYTVQPGWARGDRGGVRDGSASWALGRHRLDSRRRSVDLGCRTPVTLRLERAGGPA